MNSQKIELLRVGLKSRADKIYNIDPEKLKYYEKLLITYIDNLERFISNNSIIISFLDELEQKYIKKIERALTFILKENIRVKDTNVLVSQNTAPYAKVNEQCEIIKRNRLERILFAWKTLRHLSAPNLITNELTRIYGNIYIDKNTDNYKLSWIFFQEFIIYPLVEYLDEKLLNFDFTSHLLVKYKQQVEWFDREKLIDIINKEKGNETKKKKQFEKKLALDVYKYLFDNGVEFYIEPSSLSGEADIIEAKNNNLQNRIICDAKIYNDDKVTLKGSFNQVYNYLEMYAEQVGYVLIYNISENQRLIFDFDGFVDTLSYIEKNNRRIYYLEIWLNASNFTSSKIKAESIHIDKEYLLKESIHR